MKLLELITKYTTEVDRQDYPISIIKIVDDIALLNKYDNIKIMPSIAFEIDGECHVVKTTNFNNVIDLLTYIIDVDVVIYIHNIKQITINQDTTYMLHSYKLKNKTN